MQTFSLLIIAKNIKLHFVFVFIFIQVNYREGLTL